eukprot:m.74901 g.74901  ORF g.74901 m.74901 type:complete len:117 (+) comp35922_c0_seq5:2654-3004(+)
MEQPNNMWVEMWSMAQQVPSKRQKRLFDDTREAEKILHYLSGLSVRAMICLVTPILLHAAFDKLSQNEFSKLSSGVKVLKEASKKLASLVQSSEEDIPDCEVCSWPCIVYSRTKKF